MLRILFVSIAFPPKNDPECLQTARYFKYLSQGDELQVDIVTSGVPTLFMPYDKSLEHYVENFNQKIELPIYESKFANFIIRKLSLGQLLFPDSKMTFYWQWKKVIKQLRSKPDVIYSRSNPMSSAVMGLKLKEYYKCPWVMHLSDPWSVSPVKKKEIGDQKQIIEMEKKLFEKADAITLTSGKTLQLYKQRYPEHGDKISVLPNVYDPDDNIASGEWPQTEKLRVVYTGGMAGERNAFFLDKVINHFHDERSDCLQKVEFIFAGQLDRANKSQFQKTWPCIQHIGSLSYSQVKELYKSAHILLVIDNPTSSDGAIFFPSKILDYFVAKKMIWAVTPHQSTTRGVLAGYNHAAFDHSETESMAGFLKKCIINFENGNKDFFQVNELPADFDARINAIRLRQIINGSVLAQA